MKTTFRRTLSIAIILAATSLLGCGGERIEHNTNDDEDLVPKGR